MSIVRSGLGKVRYAFIVSALWAHNGSIAVGTPLARPTTTANRPYKMPTASSFIKLNTQSRPGRRQGTITRVPTAAAGPYEQAAFLQRWLPEAEHSQVSALIHPGGVAAYHKQKAAQAVREAHYNLFATLQDKFTEQPILSPDEARALYHVRRQTARKVLTAPPSEDLDPSGLWDVIGAFTEDDKAALVKESQAMGIQPHTLSLYVGDFAATMADIGDAEFYGRPGKMGAPGMKGVLGHELTHLQRGHAVSYPEKVQGKIGSIGRRYEPIQLYGTHPRLVEKDKNEQVGKEARAYFRFKQTQEREADVGGVTLPSMIPEEREAFAHFFEMSKEPTEVGEEADRLAGLPYMEHPPGAERARDIRAIGAGIERQERLKEGGFPLKEWRQAARPGKDIYQFVPLIEKSGMIREPASSQ